MRIYAFDLLPWPYLEKPSIYPDPNHLFDPAKGHKLYQQHLDQTTAKCLDIFERYRKTAESHGLDAAAGGSLIAAQCLCGGDQ